MNLTMVENNCADCPLRARAALQPGETEARSWNLAPESAPESQLEQMEQLERSLGANWKW
jgi:hypothetical protein